MSDPVVGPGPHSRSELRAWADAQLEAQAAEAAAKPTADEKRLAYNARMREVMRQRRQMPHVRARDKLRNKARDAAYRRLAAAFPDDFLRIVNDERIRRELPILVPRRKRTMTRTTIVEGKTVEQECESRFVERNGVDPKTCKHDQGIKKFTYGKFCVLCAKMIK